MQLKKSSHSRLTRAHKTLIVVVFVVVSTVVVQSMSGSDCRQVYKADVLLGTGTGRYTLETADTDIERVKGLSGRSCIGEYQGMLFAFDEPGKHGIWMKDMLFPVDILWLDADKKVIDKRANVSPDSYPEVFYPATDASYVIELAAGAATENDIRLGTMLNWESINK